MIKTDFYVSQMSDETSVDGRIFLRHPLYDLNIGIKNVNTGQKFLARAKDISGSGMAFMTTLEFPQGTILEISLEVPNGFGYLKLLGKVVWSKQEELFGCVTGVVILNPRFMAISRVLKLFF